jgi:F1F0 ATPase subunit 2
MNDAWGSLVAVAAGVTLGVVYTLGLWVTVNHLPRARSPGVLVAASTVLRLGVTLAGFYLVMSGSALRLVACLAGFMVARLVLVRRLGSTPLPARPAGGPP